MGCCWACYTFKHYLSPCWVPLPYIILQCEEQKHSRARPPTQAVLQHFSDVGFVRLLPEEAQWNVRALLAPVASSAAAANAAPAAQQPAPAAVAAAGQLPPAAQPGQLQPTGIELPGLMAQLLHHMATSVRRPLMLYLAGCPHPVNVQAMPSPQ